MSNTAQGNMDPHKRDDVDADTQSHHHTLGSGPTQAAPGNHLHVIWVTGDVIYSYAAPDNEEWYELNGQASPTPSLVTMFGANLPNISPIIVGPPVLKAMVHV
jgi:hypothetical protein